MFGINISKNKYTTVMAFAWVCCGGLAQYAVFGLGEVWDQLLYIEEGGTVWISLQLWAVVERRSSSNLYCIL